MDDLQLFAHRVEVVVPINEVRIARLDVRQYIDTESFVKLTYCCELWFELDVPRGTERVDDVASSVMGTAILDELARTGTTLGANLHDAMSADCLEKGESNGFPESVHVTVCQRF